MSGTGDSGSVCGVSFVSGHIGEFISLRSYCFSSKLYVWMSYSYHHNQKQLLELAMIFFTEGMKK